MAQLTQEELDQFKSFRQEANKLAGALGELHFQRTLIDLELEKIKAAVQANTAAQQDQLRQLGEKYVLSNVTTIHNRGEQHGISK